VLRVTVGQQHFTGKRSVFKTNNMWWANIYEVGSGKKNAYTWEDGFVMWCTVKEGLNSEHCTATANLNGKVADISCCRIQNRFFWYKRVYCTRKYTEMCITVSPNPIHLYGLHLPVKTTESKKKTNEECDKTRNPKGSGSSRKSSSL